MSEQFKLPKGLFVERIGGVVIGGERLVHVQVCIHGDVAYECDGRGLAKLDTGAGAAETVEAALRRSLDFVSSAKDSLVGIPVRPAPRDSTNKSKQ